MADDLARCRAEQARALANYRETGCRGALLGVSDWMLEEVVIMNVKKTAGRVAFAEYRKRLGLDMFLTEPERWEFIAAAVIAWHEAQQWRPMSEQSQEAGVLVAFETADGRWVEECIIDWRHDDEFRYIDKHNDEPLFSDLTDVTALAWRHLPKAPEVQR